jgi:CheY-like chemotaxis protein
LDPTRLILLVEDEAVIQMLLEDSLCEEGFELITASDGRQALAELDADAARFHVVVTDINFSTGPDGWDVARHARSLVPHIPIVYITGGSAHQWSAEGVPDSLLVPKPFVTAQVIKAVTTALNEGGGR